MEIVDTNSCELPLCSPADLLKLLMVEGFAVCMEWYMKGSFLQCSEFGRRDL